MELDNDTRKMRILNYLDYMDDKSLQEISVALLYCDDSSMLC